MRLRLVCATVALFALIHLDRGDDSEVDIQPSGYYRHNQEYYGYEFARPRAKPAKQERQLKSWLRYTVGVKGRKVHRLSEKPWKNEQVPKHTLARPPAPLYPVLSPCPERFDAATVARNRRTYVFAGPYVYQIWRDAYGLQQKTPYLITDLFPNGPRTVHAAMTNRLTGVTVLFHDRTVYRYRWDRKGEKKRFKPVGSPKALNETVDFTPTLAFQWFDSRMYLAGKEGKVVTYDPHWGTAYRAGTVTYRFPKLPRNVVGLMHCDSSFALWLTAKSGLHVYDVKKKRVIQEYPVRINDYVACLTDKKKL
ncbi:Protein K03B8.6 [Aphelenchoides avenae]|nr:Protein K03B8.6 [Aphelenchus avenae]